MALPGSGQISLSQVNVELGLSATAQRSLGEATTRTLFGVPSGTIKLSDGYGKSNSTASISDQLGISDIVGVPNPATAGYELNSSGQARTNVNGSYTNISGEWLVSGLNSDFECRATLNSGAVTTGTIGSWEALSSTREWTVATSNGVEAADLTIEIRRVSDSVVVDSANIYIYAESS